MSVYLQDPDVTVYHGDALTVFRSLPPESVHCCVTSPPYWGLRDYGTEGQIGLEATLEEYVARLVEVFREVRRMLRPDGTLWLNLGDAYGGSPNSGGHGPRQDGPDYRTDGVPNVKRLLKPKDLIGIPWRVAFALQTDGWYLRSDIIWSKPNPMPESVTDRPTKAHEYLFLLAKSARYYFDQEAVRESVTGNAHAWGDVLNPKARQHADASARIKQNASMSAAINGPVSNRNVRSVWEIATQPYPEAHFATYPEELVRRCILAGCPEPVCETCEQARERIVEREFVKTRGNAGPSHASDPTGYDKGSNVEHPLGYGRYDVTTTGWSDCGHGNYRPGVVLDPFLGSGTTALVARKHGRRCIGIEINEAYCALAARRLQQLSLLAEASV